MSKQETPSTPEPVVASNGVVGQEVIRLKKAIDLALFHLRRNDHVDHFSGAKCTRQMIDALEDAISPNPAMTLDAKKGTL